MDFTYVDSSTVDQIGFDNETNELHVIFKNGTHYVYSDVPPDVWAQFENSPSKGAFLNEEIKKKGYVCRKL
jgi:hypothetical protein